MHVDEIGDERHCDPIVGQRGADQAGLAMVQRSHPVEAVRHQTRAGVDGGERGLVVRGRVPERDQYPTSAEVDDGVDRAGSFGREGDDAHDVGKRLQPREVGRANERGRMRARGAAEERPLEMSPGDRRADAAGVARRGGGDSLEWRPVPVERCGHERRAPGGDPLGEESVIELVPICAVRVSDVDRTDAVDLNVDEPGDENVRLDGRRPLAGLDGGDHTVVDHHGSGTLDPGRCHDRRRGNSVHGAQFCAQTATGCFNLRSA